MRYCMDTEMWCRLHQRGVKLATLPYYVWAFRVHADSKTSHVHLGSRANVHMAEERRSIADHYGLPRGAVCDVATTLATRLVGVISGRDFRAAFDTMRYRYLPVEDVRP
jgi:hypothetical protein